MSASHPTIGYVGVGLMGLPMVTRLCSLGYRVTAYDILPAQNDKARAAGASVAGSPADAARGTTVPEPGIAALALVGIGAMRFGKRDRRRA